MPKMKWSELSSMQIGSSAEKVSKALTDLSEGNLNHEIEPSKRTDEIGQLQNSARELQQTFNKIIYETNKILGGMADCIARNSDSEEQVQARLQELDTLIIDGNKKMEQLCDAVNQIENMSADIRNVIGTIESIAFQINILSLNASVEAARVGESGRGFAVVADEVGNLATKTSEYSKQTAEMITDCLNKIEGAMRCADLTSKCLKDIVENSEQIPKAFKDISVDTKEQAKNLSKLISRFRV